LLVQCGHAVFGIHDRDDRVQPIVVGNIIVHEEGLADRAGVSHAGGLDDDALELQFACLAANAQIIQGAHQVTTHGATYATIAQLNDFFFGVLHQQFVVDTFGPEFVFDDGNASTVIFAQDALEQRGFTSAQKTSQNSDWNHVVQI